MPFGGSVRVELAESLIVNAVCQIMSVVFQEPPPEGACFDRGTTITHVIAGGFHASQKAGFIGGADFKLDLQGVVQRCIVSPAIKSCKVHKSCSVLFQEFEFLIGFLFEKIEFIH